ncbi:oxidoreductase, partial [Streptomyces tateyamensis]
MTPAPHPPSRVALIGYALAGAAFHAPLIATPSGLRLAAVVTASPERRARLAVEHPEAQVLDSPEQVFDRAEEYDLVVIATPNRT